MLSASCKKASGVQTTRTQRHTYIRMTVAKVPPPQKVPVCVETVEYQPPGPHCHPGKNKNTRGLRAAFLARANKTSMSGLALCTATVP